MTRRIVMVALTAGLLMVGLLAPSATASSLPSKSHWLADVSRAMYGSRWYVDRRVDHRAVRKPAVNFDIDNSSLESHYHYGKAIPVVLRFARHAHSKHVALLFNTGRYGAEIAKGKALLKRAGYPVREICGRRSRHESLAHSKQRCRRHFVAEGYTIIANVGNRSTDFVGGNYERAFRLPNYHNALS